VLVMFWCGTRLKTASRNPALDLPRPGQIEARNPAPNAGALASNFGGRTFRRLTNTTKNLDDLIQDPRAILLENAFLDTRASLELSLPKELRSKGDPGSYIVQSRGVPSYAFSE
jgi:hypothetical protein